MKISDSFRKWQVILIVAASLLVIPMPLQAQSAADATVNVLDQSQLDEALRTTITTAIRNQPQQRQWGGAHGEFLFGVAVRPLPSGNLRKRATPITLSTVQALADHEMLTTKAVLERYAEAGLSDVEALRSALLKASSELRLSRSL